MDPVSEYMIKRESMWVMWAITQKLKSENSKVISNNGK